MNTLHRLLAATTAAVACAAFAQGVAIDPAYVRTVKDWRVKVEQSLRRDDGWLTLAGRYPLKPGREHLRHRQG